jgi:hypothetical protein
MNGLDDDRRFESMASERAHERSQVATLPRLKPLGDGRRVDVMCYTPGMIMEHCQNRHGFCTFGESGRTAASVSVSGFVKPKV